MLLLGPMISRYYGQVNHVFYHVLIHLEIDPIGPLVASVSSVMLPNTLTPHIILILTSTSI